MTDFVEQCRREWRRLGVPDPVAEEMAADLATDLLEAETEGVSVEELLGSSAFDPRSFAASWAAERGVVPAGPDGGPRRRRPVGLIAFTAVAAVAVVVAAALLLSGEPKVSVVTRTAHLRVPPPVPAPAGAGGQVLSASAATPVEWILLLLAIVALGFAAWLWSGWARSRSSDVAV